MLRLTEVAEDPKKLEYAMKMFEMIDRSAATTSVIFPKQPSRAIIQRTYADAWLYVIIEHNIGKHAASDEKNDDALQHMLDQGDRAFRIVEFIARAPFAGLLNDGIEAGWIMCYLAISPESLAKTNDEIRSTAARYAKDPNAPLHDYPDGLGAKCHHELLYRDV